MSPCHVLVTAYVLAKDTEEGHWDDLWKEPTFPSPLQACLAQQISHMMPSPRMMTPTSDAFPTLFAATSAREGEQHQGWVRSEMASVTTSL